MPPMLVGFNLADPLPRFAIDFPVPFFLLIIFLRCKFTRKLSFFCVAVKGIKVIKNGVSRPHGQATPSGSAVSRRPSLSVTTRTAQADSLTFKAQSKETSNCNLFTYMNLNGQGVSQRPVTDHNKLT